MDYFDDETALRILVGERLSEEDAKYGVDWIGGVPWMMERVLSNGDVREKVKELHMIHKGRLREFLGRAYDEGGEEFRESLKGVLRKMLNGEEIDLEGKDRPAVKKLVESEMLFYDPLRAGVRFQTRLDEKAARGILSREQPELLVSSTAAFFIE